jgi:hypothetical protein
MTAFQFVKPGRSAHKLDHEGRTCLKGPVFNDTGFPVFIGMDQLDLFSQDDRMVSGLDLYFLSGFLGFGLVSDLDRIGFFSDKDLIFQVRV